MPSFMGMLGVIDGRMAVCSTDWNPLLAVVSGGSSGNSGHRVTTMAAMATIIEYQASVLS